MLKLAFLCIVLETSTDRFFESFLSGECVNCFRICPAYGTRSDTFLRSKFEILRINNFQKALIHAEIPVEDTDVYMRLKMLFNPIDFFGSVNTCPMLGFFSVSYLQCHCVLL